VHKVILDKLDLKDHQVREHKVLQVHKEFRVQWVHKGRDRRVLKDFKVLQVHKVLKVLRVLKELKVMLV
tara:strand:+ start:38 stop:244 length:207 start_codon:yes stop_codon:yes gene_type:complete